MPPDPCAYFCPQLFAGYDTSSGRYYYWGYNCPVDPTNPNAMASDTSSHAVGGTCASGCPGCFQPLLMEPADDKDDQPDPLFLPRPPLKRRVFHKGAPHAADASRLCDDFLLGPTCVILAEFTADYERSDAKGAIVAVRFLTIAHPEVAGRVVGLGWEVDAASGASPVPVPHLPKEWVTVLKAEPGGFRVRVQGLGEFHVHATAKP